MQIQLFYFFFFCSNFSSQEFVQQIHLAGMRRHSDVIVYFICNHYQLFLNNRQKFPLNGSRERKIMKILKEILVSSDCTRCFRSFFSFRNSRKSLFCWLERGMLADKILMIRKREKNHEKCSLASHECLKAYWSIQLSGVFWDIIILSSSRGNAKYAGIWINKKKTDETLPAARSIYFIVNWRQFHCLSDKMRSKKMRPARSVPSNWTD